MKFFTKTGEIVPTRAIQTKKNNAICKQELAQLTQECLDEIAEMTTGDLIARFFIRPMAIKAIVKYENLPVLEELQEEIKKGRTLADCLYLYALIVLKSKLDNFSCLDETFYVFPSFNLLVFASDKRLIILDKTENEVDLYEYEDSEFALSFLEQAKEYLEAFKDLKILYKQRESEDEE